MDDETRERLEEILRVTKIAAKDTGDFQFDSIARDLHQLLHDKRKIK